MTPDQIAEGRAHVEALREPPPVDINDDFMHGVGQMQADAWLRNHATALLDAAERLARLTCSLREMMHRKTRSEGTVGRHLDHYAVRDLLEDAPPCPHERDADEVRAILRDWVAENPDKIDMAAFDAVPAQVIRNLAAKWRRSEAEKRALADNEGRGYVAGIARTLQDATLDLIETLPENATPATQRSAAARLRELQADLLLAARGHQNIPHELVIGLLEASES